MRMIRRFSVLIALISAVALLAQGSAYAAPNAVAAAITGSGTIGPGLTTIPTPQSVTFGGNAVGTIVAVPGASAGIYNCSFTGSSSNDLPGPLANGDSLAAGKGTVNGSCSGGTIGTGSAICAVIYIRVGPIVVIIFTCGTSASGPTGSGSGNGTGVGVFLFVPDQATPPVTSYRLAGVVAGAGAA
ncbi:MAG: hypothetical protein QOK43_1543 [Acidimicrobiaceae bacterium]|nr:hypothetical protein [Acidimicrobiaceae bacterium]